MPSKRSQSSVLAQPLGELELSVLGILWRSSALDAKSVALLIERDNPPSLSTVQSTLERLVKKSLADRQKRGHAYYYRPRVSRSELLGRMMSQMIRLLHDGRTSTILSSFVNVAADLDSKSLDKLEQLIERKRRSEEQPDER